MAARKKASSPTATRKVTRTYMVVSINGESLTVLDPARDARNQAEAMEAVASTIPPEQRNVSLGAFLASSFKAKVYKTKQEFVTESAASSPAFMDRVGKSAPALKSVAETQTAA